MTPGTALIETATDRNITALAFDYGERHIGVAFANRATGTATALKTLTRRDPDELDRALRALFDEWNPDTIVIGVPYNMDGSEAPITAVAIDFAQRLAQEYELPVERVDERLTSAAAEEILREQRRSGQRRRKVREGDVDGIAAQLIADSWIRQR
jgi:putative Holliday junction resolvase